MEVVLVEENERAARLPGAGEHLSEQLARNTPHVP
jgi:hypothetical protein